MKEVLDIGLLSIEIPKDFELGSMKNTAYRFLDSFGLMSCVMWRFSIINLSICVFMPQKSIFLLAGRHLEQNAMVALWEIMYIALYTRMSPEREEFCTIIHP